MSATYSIPVGEKGRLVVPAGVRAHHGWVVGDRLIAVDTPSGLLLTDRARLRKIVREQLADSGDLVGELLAERRAEAEADDGG